MRITIKIYKNEMIGKHESKKVNLFRNDIWSNSADVYKYIDEN